MFSNLIYGGEIAALLAAFFWAGASHFFDRAGKRIGSVELNLFKGAVALVFLVATAVLTGVHFSNLDAQTLTLLVLSGIIGIGVGDTVFFKALESIGPRRALLVSSITPAMTALIAWGFLDEALAPRAWLGMTVTIAGIIWVVTERPGAGKVNLNFPLKGLAYALLYALSQAVGAVLSRAALHETSVSSLQSALLRLAAGMVVLMVWVWVRRIPLGGWLKGADSRRIGIEAFVATILGTYLGMWLQQTSFKLSPVAIAETLSSTSPIFILPIAALAHDRVSLRAIFGALLASLGVMMLFTV